MTGYLYFAKSKIPGAGRGVFTMKPFKKDDVVEACPVLVFDPIDEPTFLKNYSYLWGEKELALALGYGSLYNHSHFANLEYFVDIDSRTIIYTAARDIRRGEELTIDYGEHYGTDDFDATHVELFQAPEEE